LQRKKTDECQKTLQKTMASTDMVNDTGMRFYASSNIRRRHYVFGSIFYFSISVYSCVRRTNVSSDDRPVYTMFALFVIR